MRSRFGKTTLEMAEDDRDELRELLAECREDLAKIVELDGRDAGVILLSDESPTHWDDEAKCRVYDHDHFSPLGDALVALGKKMGSLTWKR